MNSVLIDFAQWFRPYQTQCAMAIIATLLVLFGAEISQAIRQLIKKQHILVRTLVFVFVCAFGYGALTVWLTGLFSQWLGMISDLYLMPVILLIFIVLGLYAQKQRHI
ncbi:DUF3392 domain-containing protein [Thalassotalea sp. M1531]|uniref:DUF3392 domain-containing protein n=1 Tax=Thalassotalea algicola TaxID=2716224 RepID=A0A7Y0LBV2_9GAMM|nr:DUF3392 domain-containing protein [Thalassotalea algicola]NMP31364.1 DUF3392 domain-containing protein [Thalassotalea algicola]